MNTATKIPGLPALTEDLLQSSDCLVDNLFADLWKSMGMNTLLSKAGFNKRSGTPITELVYVLTLWVWLKKGTIGMFARESLHYFTTAEKDALYSTLNREDLNWRKLNLQTAVKTIKQMPSQSTKAFVLDDSIKIRHGKKMPGVSSHFDHTLGRSVMGQQVLTLGYSCEQGFVSLDSEIFISKVKAQELYEDFKDARSIVGKRYFQAQQLTKPQMAKSMMARAIRGGVKAEFLLADAWFGTKAMLRSTEELSLTAIVRMKKSKLKYRLTTYKNEQEVVRDLDLKALYKQTVRKKWQKISGQAYQCKGLDVQLNLANSEKEPEQWRNVRLLFVRGNTELEKQETGKHDWAVFLSTDINLEPEKILEIYALRWAVEVYFKEAKQHLGFLKEQSTHYAAYIASIHLVAIRFCLLISAKQNSEASGFSEVRSSLSHNLRDINYATRLWQVFKAIITGALNELKDLLGETVILVMETIEQHIHCFFVQALQLDPKTLQLETQ
jgi:SRSO17 transposase